MRGEYKADAYDCFIDAELPPRARRIPLRRGRHHQRRGTTSACAENTVASFFACFPMRNYLRVRGEYTIASCWSSQKQELPPRARRIHYSQLLVKSKAGTTSACAENTLLRWLIPYCVVELPPRARRIRRTSLLGVASVGTTSACAENTTLRCGWIN